MNSKSVISCKPIHECLTDMCYLTRPFHDTMFTKDGFLNAKSKKLVFLDSAYPHPPAKKMCHCILSLVTLVTMYTYMVWIVLDCSGLCIKYFLGLVGII